MRTSHGIGSEIVFGKQEGVILVVVTVLAIKIALNHKTVQEAAVSIDYSKFACFIDEPNQLLIMIYTISNSFYSFCNP